MSKLITGLVATLTLSGISAGASAVDGTIHFTGSIVSAACTVSSIADSASTIGTVDFGVLSSQTLSANETSSVRTPFSIKLTDCNVAEAPQIAFFGNTVVTAESVSVFTTEVPGVAIRIGDAGESGVWYTPGIAMANSGFNILGGGVIYATL